MSDNHRLRSRSTIACKVLVYACTTRARFDEAPVRYEEPGMLPKMQTYDTMIFVLRIVLLKWCNKATTFPDYYFFPRGFVDDGKSFLFFHYPVGSLARFFPCFLVPRIAQAGGFRFSYFLLAVTRCFTAFCVFVFVPVVYTSAPTFTTVHYSTKSPFFWHDSPV